MAEWRQRRIAFLGGPDSTTGFTTYGFSNGHFLAGYLQSSGSQNDYAEWSFPLRSGTYTLSVLHSRNTNCGIYAVTIDGATPTSLGGSADTIDGYNSPFAPTRSQITGIAVATNALHLVRFTMATKNASSSSYFGVVNALEMTRTGA